MRSDIKSFVILFLVLLLSITTTMLFVNYRENRNFRRESQISKKINDSVQNKLLNKNDDLLKLIKEIQHNSDSLNGQSKNKYIDGILLGNEPISLKELIQLANKYQTQSIRLIGERFKDSLKIKRLQNIISQLERDKMITKNNDGSYSYRPITKVDSIYKAKVAELDKVKTDLQAKNMLLGLIKKNYDIDSEIEYKGDIITVKLLNTKKLDSALWIYPYYKHKIKTNSKGETVIR